MFAESLLDTSWADRSRRGWTTMASFGFLAFAVGVLMALPVLYPEGISQLRTTATLISPAPLGRPRPGPAHARANWDPSLCGCLPHANVDTSRSRL